MATTTNMTTVETLQFNYNTEKTNYKLASSNVDKYQTFYNQLNEMKRYGFDVLNAFEQAKSLVEMNENLKKTSKEIIDRYESEVREFSLLILISDEGKIWISQRINSLKDYFEYWQVAGGRKNNNETFEECAKREAKEETDLYISEAQFICFHEGFRKFPDDVICMFRCAIYFALINDQVPVRNEPINNGEWKSVDLKELKNYQLTNSLSIKLALITKAINSKFKSIRQSKKRKLINDDTEENITTSPEETTKVE
jgi:8-oxo-dGTP pyrophosphatase MutT (NUDIX family)